MKIKSNDKCECSLKMIMILNECLIKYREVVIFMGFPGGSESACNGGDLGLIPGLERSPGEGNGNSLQYSCLENPRDRGA